MGKYFPSLIFNNKKRWEKLKSLVGQFVWNFNYFLEKGHKRVLNCNYDICSILMIHSIQWYVHRKYNSFTASIVSMNKLTKQ